MEKEREEEGGKQQLDSELKLELIPSALFNTSLFLLSPSLFPSGLYVETFCRQQLLFVGLRSHILDKHLYRKCIKRGGADNI